MDATKHSVHSSMTKKAGGAFSCLHDAEMRQEEALELLLCAKADQINNVIHYSCLSGAEVALNDVLSFNHSLLCFIDFVMMNMRLLRRKKEDLEWLKQREECLFGMSPSEGADLPLECSYDQNSNSGVRLIESIVRLIEWEVDLEGGRYAVPLKLQFINLLGILHEFFMFASVYGIVFPPLLEGGTTVYDPLEQTWILRLNRAILPLAAGDEYQWYRATDALKRLKNLLNRCQNRQIKSVRTPCPPFIRVGVCTAIERQRGQRH